jgi:hypothetical protein
MENKSNYDVLKEVCNGAKMGMESTYAVKGKLKINNSLKQELSQQYNDYKKIYNKVISLEPNLKIENAKGKTMSSIGIELNTFTNKSDSKIAEIMIQGTDMGIIKGRKLLNNFSNNIPTETKDLLNTFVNMQEQNITKLKAYL